MSLEVDQSAKTAKCRPRSIQWCGGRRRDSGFVLATPNRTTYAFRDRAAQ
jgi:hypothetical protein